MNAAAAFPRPGPPQGSTPRLANATGSSRTCTTARDPAMPRAKCGFPRQRDAPAGATKKGPEGDCRSGPDVAGIRPELGERTNAREHSRLPLESTLYVCVHKPRLIPCFCWVRMPASCRCRRCAGRGVGAGSGYDNRKTPASPFFNRCLYGSVQNGCGIRRFNPPCLSLEKHGRRTCAARLLRTLH